MLIQNLVLDEELFWKAPLTSHMNFHYSWILGQILIPSQVPIKEHAHSNKSLLTFYMFQKEHLPMGGLNEDSVKGRALNTSWNHESWFLCQSLWYSDKRNQKGFSASESKAGLNWPLTKESADPQVWNRHFTKAGGIGKICISLHNFIFSDTAINFHEGRSLSIS